MRRPPRAADVGQAGGLDVIAAHGRLAAATGFVLAIAAVLTSSSGCGGNSPAATPPPVPEVEVERPVTRELIDYSEFTGRLAAMEEVQVRTRVRGYLQTIHYREGAEVHAGDLLYTIDPRTFEADVARAEAELDRQRAQLELAASEAARFERLRGRDVVSPEELQQRVANRESARAAVESARAALETARLELGFTEIRSPIDGRVGRTLVTEGNLVGYSEPTLLTTVVRVDPIYVYFEATEREYLEYQRLIRERGVPSAVDGSIPVEVGLENEDGYPHAGLLDFRDNRIDPGTGTIALRGILPNPDRVLTPGLYARVRVPVGQPAPRLLVPEVALGADQRGTFLLVVGKGDVVETRTVTIGPPQPDGRIVISSGLNPDDLVIVNGLLRARPGTTVRPVEPGTGPGPADGPTPAAGNSGGQPSPSSTPSGSGSKRDGVEAPSSDVAAPVAPAVGTPPAAAPTGNAPGS